MIFLYFLLLLLTIAAFAGISIKLIKTTFARKKALLVQMIIIACISLAGVMLPLTFNAEGTSSEKAGQSTKVKTEMVECVRYISSAIAIAIPAIGSGFALSSTAPAAIAAISESPKISGKILLYAALAEGILIFGLLISIMILAF